MEVSLKKDLAACGSLLWRSFFLMPLMLAVWLVVGTLWLSRYLLPIPSALFIYAGHWSMAWTFLAIWAAVMICFRGLKLKRMFERAPSYL
ncbi:hypothetical protein Rhal01_01025 [Rubritalea halochordaticola]|uniref:Uncharacterized protein n=1 Tax=Rubritalea halochordaticola TaxID=714537 RepID=A0ABP9UWL5_9BACT